MIFQGGFNKGAFLRGRPVNEKGDNEKKDHNGRSGHLDRYAACTRGDAGKDSDWDLLILLDKPDLSESDYDNISFPFAMFGWNIGEIISPQMYTKKDWESISFLPFYKNVEHDKIVLI